MNTYILLELFLILHLCGLALMAGTTATAFFIFNNFCKTSDKNTALSLFRLMGKLSKLLSIGGALLIFSGLGLLIITHAVFLHQLWFRIKLLLILLLVLNGFLFGGRHESKLSISLEATEGRFNDRVVKSTRNLKLFFLIQLALFFTIIILAVFKFN